MPATAPARPCTSRNSHFAAAPSLRRGKVQCKHPVCPFAAVRLTPCSKAGIQNRDTAVFRYQRHQPEPTLLYRIIEQHYPIFLNHLAAQDKTLPKHVTREFDDYLKCGRLEYGFLRVRCSACRHEQLVAFSCKRRGFCPRGGARRMAESAALLVADVLPHAPIRQWVLSVPFPLRFLFATQPAIMGEVLGIITRAIATHLIKKAGHTHASAHTGAVTLNQDVQHHCPECAAPFIGRALLDRSRKIMRDQQMLNHNELNGLRLCPSCRARNIANF